MDNGRPRPRRNPANRRFNLVLTPIDDKRLKALSKHLELDETKVIRQALKAYYEKLGLDKEKRF